MAEGIICVNRHTQFGGDLLQNGLDLPGRFAAGKLTEDHSGGSVKKLFFQELIKLLAVTGAPFVLVSLMRRFINAPRPYELLEFYKRKPKGKAGKSFPSRHVFSVFIIATVLIPTDPLLSAALFAAGALLAFLRVALGIHFVRDVVAGALIGAATGGIGLLVLHFV